MVLSPLNYENSFVSLNDSVSFIEKNIFTIFFKSRDEERFVYYISTTKKSFHALLCSTLLTFKPDWLSNELRDTSPLVTWYIC